MKQSTLSDTVLALKYFYDANTFISYSFTSTVLSKEQGFREGESSEFLVGEEFYFLNLSSNFVIGILPFLLFEAKASETAITNRGTNHILADFTILVSKAQPLAGLKVPFDL